MAKLLVVIDPDRKDQPALDRAIEIADLTEIALHVALFVEHGSLHSAFVPQGSDNLSDHLQAVLESLVEPYRERGKEITTEVRPFKRLYEAIIQVALREDVSIVVKPTRYHTAFRRMLFTSTDWNLIRLCPFALLMVSDSKAVSGRDVIAAVEVAEDDDHDELNQLILSRATGVSRLLGSHVRVVNAVIQPASLLAYSPGEVVNLPDKDDLEDDHRRRCEALAARFDIPTDQVIVREGPAEEVVNEAAENHRAALIILGTVARSGLAGLFIGNTAERLLEESRTDVLVIKQADFKSPIQLVD